MSTDAILALVQLEAWTPTPPRHPESLTLATPREVSEGHTAEAITLLRRHLEIQNTEMVRTELGNLLMTEVRQNHPRPAGGALHTH